MKSRRQFLQSLLAAPAAIVAAPAVVQAAAPLADGIPIQVDWIRHSVRLKSRQIGCTQTAAELGEWLGRKKLEEFERELLKCLHRQSR